MIKGYVGNLGQGKTLNMVYDIMQIMKRKWHRAIVSNTPIKFKHGGKIYEAEFYGTGDAFERQIIHRQNAVFVVDEASVFFPNNYWNRLPKEYIAKFAQSRKFGCDFYYTSQGLGHTVKRLRDLTNVVVSCKKRKLFGLFGPDIFYADGFDPMYFGRALTSRKSFDRYHIYSRTLYPRQYRFVYKAFNTKYVVQDSALVKMTRLGQPGEVRTGIEDPGSVPDGGQTATNGGGLIKPMPVVL